MTVKKDNFISRILVLILFRVLKGHEYINVNKMTVLRDKAMHKLLGKHLAQFLA
jgi:hypothetical protein